MEVERKRVRVYPTYKLVLISVLSFILIFEFMFLKDSECIYIPLWLQFIIFSVLFSINAPVTVAVLDRLCSSEIKDMKEKHYDWEETNKD